jgi:UDP-glucose 4-epimerase
MKTVVVTGAGGYVGGQTAIYFHDQGWRVIGIDRDHPPKHLAQSTYFSKFYVGPFDSEDALELIKNSKPDAIIHTAGTSLVGPSERDPRPYYQNNFVATKTLVEYLLDNNIKTHFVFSSSAATYGEPILPPCREEDPPLPLSPYGESKLMTEMMLESYANAYGLKYTAFRYFNVCGADPQQRHGQRPGATHIFARVLEAIRDNKEFTLMGTTFPTQDGSAVRDYVHVCDIAKAHMLAIEYNTHGVYNLSIGTGYSNKEIINTAFNVTGKNIPVNEAEFRPGDPSVLTGSAEKFTKETGWTPTYTLDDIIKTVCNWYTND